MGMCPLRYTHRNIHRHRKKIYKGEKAHVCCTERRCPDYRRPHPMGQADRKIQYPPIISVSWSTEGARPQTNFCEKSRKSAGHPTSGLKMVRMPQKRTTQVTPCRRLNLTKHWISGFSCGSCSAISQKYFPKL